MEKHPRPILIIGKDPGAMACVYTLEFQGCETITAHTLREGLDSIGKRELCTIILVNKTSKFSAASIRGIRSNPALAAVPVIVIGAEMTYADSRKWLDAGADDCLDIEDVEGHLPGVIKRLVNVHEAASASVQRAMDTLRHNVTTAMPHELRTALVGIMGFASMLREDSATLTPGDIRDMVGYIERSAQRMQRQVESYTWYTRLHTKQVTGRNGISGYDHVCEHLAEIIHGIAYQYAEATMRASDLVIEVEDAHVLMYDEYVQKILSELIDNALKFSHHGTPVHIRSVVDGAYTVEISDQGRGMTAEQLAQVGAYMQFEREVYEQQGAGMGLTIAGSLAELYGAHLSIESCPGKGTTVCVTFPLAGAKSD